MEKKKGATPCLASRWRAGRLNDEEGSISTKQNTYLYWAFNEAIVCVTRHGLEKSLQELLGLMEDILAGQGQRGPATVFASTHSVPAIW